MITYNFQIQNLPEVNFSSSTSPVTLIMSLVFYPISLENLHILVIDLFLSLPDLTLSVLGAVAMEEIVFEVSFISHLFIGVV